MGFIINFLKYKTSLPNYLFLLYHKSLANLSIEILKCYFLNVKCILLNHKFKPEDFFAAGLRAVFTRLQRRIAIGSEYFEKL